MLGAKASYTVNRVLQNGIQKSQLIRARERLSIQIVLNPTPQKI